MAKPYSEDLRLKCLELIQNGYEIQKVVTLLNISQATIYRWVGLKRRGEPLKPKENYQHGYNPKITDMEVFKSFVDENQGLTSVEMASKWGNIDPKTFRKWLHRIGYSRKKKLTAIVNVMKKSAKHIWKN